MIRKTFKGLQYYIFRLVIVDRSTTCRKAFRAFIEKYGDFFGENQFTLYYNLQSILFSLNPLAIPPGHSQEFQLFAEENSQLPANLASIEMRISNVREMAQSLSLNDPSSLIDPQTMARDRSLLNCLELAIKQLPLQDE